MSACVLPCAAAACNPSGQVLLNHLRAHTAAYRAIKALPGGEQHKVWVCLPPCAGVEV